MLKSLIGLCALKTNKIVAIRWHTCTAVTQGIFSNTGNKGLWSPTVSIESTFRGISENENGFEPHIHVDEWT